MVNLIDIQREADQLSEEDRAGLAAHLLASITSAPLGAADAEVLSAAEGLDVDAPVFIPNGGVDSVAVLFQGAAEAFDAQQESL